MALALDAVLRETGAPPFSTKLSPPRITEGRTLRRERCGVYAPMRRRSTARRNSVLTEVPDAGTHLAPGTKILLIVSNGRRR